MPVDPSAYVAPTARVHPDAVIGPQCRIGEYCIIEQDVILGSHNVLEPYVYVKPYTTIGDRNEIGAHTVLGVLPLDKNFGGERSYLVMGNGNRVREQNTLSRGTGEDSRTIIGDDLFLMTCCHIAHNCILGNSIIFASCSNASGYCEIGDQAYISACIGIHQFTRIGRNVMVGAVGRVNMDLPPYFLYNGHDVKPHGLNVVGLRRAGFTSSDIGAIKTAYRLLYRSGLKLEEALERIETEVPTPHTKHLVEFIRASKRGIRRE
ncbi:MAG: acyl-ACP--UDP-N-acetylglucosamine O-acyltransferase [Acidobacteria bacterium]|nr:acyl-ACP--UDP-N-acetylglucosamine O-acyltransferase [Acidobacteriota bacterium]